jgi:helix-hairpin-helix protein
VLSLPRGVFVVLAILLARESAFGANKKPPLRPVNLNTMTVQQLQQVPGIAPATADKILKMGKYVTAGRTAPQRKLWMPPHLVQLLQILLNRRRRRHQEP